MMRLPFSKVSKWANTMSTSNLPGPGLPDIELLNELANQLFAEKRLVGPGGFQPAPLPPAPSATGFPNSPGDAPVSIAPAVPGAAGFGLPLSDNGQTDFAAPTDAQLREVLAPRPALPQVSHAAPPIGAVSFYFIEPERTIRHTAAAGAGSALAGFPAAVSTRVPDQPISHGSDLHKLGAPPPGYGLPSDAQLQALLSPDQFGGGAASARPRGPQNNFLENHPGITRAVQDRNRRADDDHLGSHTSPRPFDINRVRADFPIFNEVIDGKPLIWLDNAATTQKPRSVIDRIVYFYEHENSNIHRAAHALAARATDAYESARETVRSFLNAAFSNEIVFARGATEAINLVAKSWGQQHLRKDDEIVISWLEHHANIVPWQQLCAQTGAVLKVIPVDDDGQILLDEYAKLLGPRTRLVAFTQVSNALGTVTPAQQMVAMAHAAGARVLVDGAQSVPHLRVDVRALDCDWFVFSGHKVFGPTGIGVLYGKEDLLNATAPWQGGGNMIRDVTFAHTEYHAAPARFEAGTGNIADAVGLGAAIDYVNKIGIDHINQYEHELLLYAIDLLKAIPGLRLIGTAPDKASVLSFVLEGFKTEEVGAALNRAGIAVRSGHHCAQPILRRFGLESTVRPSLAFYNTRAEVDALVLTVLRLKRGSRSARS